MQDNNYLDEARNLLDMFSDDDYSDDNNIEEDTSDTFLDTEDVKENTDESNIEEEDVTEKVAYGVKSQSNPLGGLLATTAAGLAGSYLKDKLFAPEDKATAELSKLGPEELKNRMQGHVLDYTTSKLPKELLRTALGVTTAKNLYDDFSSKENAAQQEELDNKLPAMIAQLKKSEALSNLDWSNPEVAQLLDTVTTNYPNVSKNYFMLHELLNTYQNMGTAGSIPNFKQLGDIEKNLAKPKVTIQEIATLMKSLPDDKTTSTFVEKKDPMEFLKNLTGSLGSIMKLSSEKKTPNEEAYSEFFKYAKEHFFNKFKLAYLEDRVNAARELYKKDEIFNKVANELSNDFDKTASSALDSLQIEYNDRIVASEMCMLKIAKHYNLFEKDAEELKKWRTIYHKEFTDLTDDFRNLKKDSKIMSNNKNK